ncbi:MAG: signal peptidase II [Candidatus Margulisiibacteriota bacterium]|nr:MAG: signal peptidase II [Candidatus Margulisbacteria bacterium GWD2_39_127]OGI02128.1 MAG: signal peptidase II [Candidatus Margulisbacteria bacterium GWF2_38_17]OGI10504.1 MAG: signal peptidase II [Candidatus Margulisbacteria bacterium GWE2_39_32]PZM79950.1 MAG: signal peptidase II [Candidatus Margulisiibacteriota bacterium]HAR62412.1 signal peptidase II [Candidatus Margulisiibacteriota bacterium]
MVIFYYIIIALIFLFDQLTKYLIFTSLPFGHEFKVSAFLSIAHVQNKGAAFGLFRNQQLFLIIIGILVLFIVTIYRYRKPEASSLLTIGVAFLMGGNLGNLFDRIYHGFVVDFIRIPYWPTFNIADITINIGVLLISIFLITTNDENKVTAHDVADSSDYGNN